MRQKIFITVTLLMLEIGISMMCSQSINLKEINGTQTSYKLNKVKKLTFDNGVISIHFEDNSETNFLLNNLINIKFSDLASGFNTTTHTAMKNLIVYPNPVKDILYCKLSNSDLRGSIVIESVDGRYQLSVKCNDSANSINVSRLPSGVYFCSYVSEKNIKKVKFIKKNCDNIMKSIRRLNKFFLPFVVISAFVQPRAEAQNDTIFFMKKGEVTAKQSILKADIDSAVFYNPEISEANTSIDSIYFVKSGKTVNRISIMAQDMDSLTFKQPEATTNGTFVDKRDGNVYKWIKIGNQIWMAENLRYLPTVIGPEVGSRTLPYIYVYGYKGTSVAEAKATANYSIYGVLYNWTAAMAGEASSSSNPSGVKGLCPEGWHIPSDAEWTQLTTFLGGSSAAGGKLKETGTNHWKSPNLNATNLSGFSALPGGDRYGDGTFFYLNDKGKFWSCTGSTSVTAWYRQVTYDSGIVERKQDGSDTANYIRCVKD